MSWRPKDKERWDIARNTLVKTHIGIALEISQQESQNGLITKDNAIRMANYLYEHGADAILETLKANGQQVEDGDWPELDLIKDSGWLVFIPEESNT